jgi:hypothetical protein
VQGVHPDVSAAQMQLLTAKLAAKDLAELKKKLLRPGFVEEWNHLDAQAAEFAKVLLSKENAKPSATYTLFTTYAAEAVLWLGFTSKQAAVREKYDNFLKVWPQARQKVPYALMAGDADHARTAGLCGSGQDHLPAADRRRPDHQRRDSRAAGAAFAPAPPPPVTIKRTRAKKGADAKSKAGWTTRMRIRTIWAVMTTRTKTTISTVWIWAATIWIFRSAWMMPGPQLPRRKAKRTMSSRGIRSARMNWTRTRETTMETSRTTSLPRVAARVDERKHLQRLRGVPVQGKMQVQRSEQG